MVNVAAAARAAGILRSLADELGEEELRDGFLAAPMVRSVLKRG